MSKGHMEAIALLKAKKRVVGEVTERFGSIVVPPDTHVDFGTFPAPAYREPVWLIPKVVPGKPCPCCQQMVPKSETVTQPVTKSVTKLPRVTKSKAGRPKAHASPAERQAAYRARKKATG